MNEEIELVIDTTCLIMGLDREEVMERRNKSPDMVFRARAIISAELSRVWGMTLKRNAEVFGLKTHCAIIYQREKYRDMYAYDRQFREKAEAVKWEIDLVRNSFPA